MILILRVKNNFLKLVLLIMIQIHHTLKNLEEGMEKLIIKLI